MNKLHRITSITEFHRLRGLPKPAHPLISLVDIAEIKRSPRDNDVNWAFDFYTVSLKRNCHAKFKYGQQEYDFDEGIMFFISPGQVLRIEAEDTVAADRSGWMLLIHPDFLWNTSLAGAIRKYDYFGYAVHEALFLSDKEEQTILGVLGNIGQEINSNIDRFSQNIIISHIATLLNYADRFYHRQFITRKISNHHVLERLDKILDDYFESDDLIGKGLPSVQFIAGSLNISAGYLSVMLRTLTGQSTQQHIHEKLIAKAKEKLSTTTLSIREIAYELGFEHSQSFSKLFKAKTNLSPQAFRHSFN